MGEERFLFIKFKIDLHEHGSGTQCEIQPTYSIKNDDYDVLLIVTDRNGLQDTFTKEVLFSVWRRYGAKKSFYKTCDGRVYLEPNGAKQPYDYQWADQNGIMPGENYWFM